MEIIEISATVLSLTGLMMSFLMAALSISSDRRFSVGRRTGDFTATSHTAMYHSSGHRPETGGGDQ